MNLDRFIQIVSEIIKIKKEEINEESNIYDDLGMDDLELLKIKVALENELMTSYPDDVFDEAVNIGDMYRIIL